MSWSITISGTKDAAKATASADADRSIAAGNMTEGQKAMVLAIIDATPGEIVGGAVSGHNNDDGLGGYISASTSGGKEPA